MAICYYCSGSARCQVCTGTGIQGDGRTCAVCGGNGRCTHCTGGVMRGPDTFSACFGAAFTDQVRAGLRWTALALLVASFGAAATPAQADYRVVDFTQAKATKAIGIIDPEDGVLVRGVIGPGKPIANTLTFTPRQPTVAVSISWLVGLAGAASAWSASMSISRTMRPLRRAGPGGEGQADADGYDRRDGELRDGGGGSAVNGEWQTGKVYVSQRHQ